MKNSLMESKENVNVKEQFMQQEIQKLQSINKKLQDKVDEVVESNKNYEIERIKSQFVQSVISKNTDSDDLQRKIIDRDSEISHLKSETQRLEIQLRNSNQNKMMSSSHIR
jgi:hypothetical protein